VRRSRSKAEDNQSNEKQGVAEKENAYQPAKADNLRVAKRLKVSAENKPQRSPTVLNAVIQK
jgi:hypothetical protein